MTLTRRSALKSLALSLVAGAECWAIGAHRWRAAPADAAAFLDAVRRGDLERVRRMLRQLPGLAATRDPDGVSALIHARLGGHAEVVEVLREAGLVLDIAEAAMLEDWPRFEQLANEHPELLNALHPVGGTPLYAAALAGSQDLYRLRSAGCLPDHEHRRLRGR